MPTKQQAREMARAMDDGVQPWWFVYDADGWVGNVPANDEGQARERGGRIWKRRIVKAELHVQQRDISGATGRRRNASKRRSPETVIRGATRARGAKPSRDIGELLQALQAARNPAEKRSLRRTLRQLGHKGGLRG